MTPKGHMNTPADHNPYHYQGHTYHRQPYWTDTHGLHLCGHTTTNCTLHTLGYGHQLPACTTTPTALTTPP